MKSRTLFSSLILGILVFFAVGMIVKATTAEEERTALEKELAALELQIDKYENDITKTQQEKKTLQNQISILKNKISKLDLQIKQSNLLISDLSLQIQDTEDSIEKTSQKIEDSKVKLGETLQLIYEEDQKPFVEVLLAESTLSGFFDNLMSLEALTAKSEELLNNIQQLKIDLESQRESLDGEKEEMEGVVKMQSLQKQESESNKSEQEKLLVTTKSKEAEYQKLLEASKKKASEIRARIFELIGVPDAPTFGEAVDLAKYAESATGVRAAFLLAILTQESNLGKNVGQCYLTNTQTGAGVIAKTNQAVTRVMKPTRDVTPFLEITKAANRDPFKTVVSCPMSYGWGGAMGPAQFIPSTWIGYSSRVKAITGSADPWNIRDAFVAAALYLKDKGADQKTYNAEWRAAISYFAGYVNLSYRFYGDSVMSIVAKYEIDIEAIGK